MARKVQVVTGPAYAPQDRAEAMADAMTTRALRSRAPQQGGPVQVAMSPWEGVAQLGEAFIANRLNKRVMDLAKADQERQLAANDAMIRQLAGEKAPRRLNEQGQPVGAPVQMPTDLEGRPMMLSDKAEALSAAMQGLDPKAANQVLAGETLRRAFAEPVPLKEVDLGDSIGLMDSGGNIVRRLPKGATPDTALREQGENRRFDNVSGNTRATVGATMRGQDVSANTAMRGQNLSHDAALRAADATASNRDLQAQRFEMDKAKFDREARAEAIDRSAKLDDVQKMQSNVQGLLDDPGFDTIYGKSRFMSPSMLPGGTGADAEARRSQLEAAAFGISIQQMKGLGALSNAEGLKVTAAYTRAVDPKQSEKAAREAWAEVQGYLKTAQSRIESGGLMAPASAPAMQGDPTIDSYMQKYGGAR